MIPNEAVTAFDNCPTLVALDALRGHLGTVTLALGAQWPPEVKDALRRAEVWLDPNASDRECEAERDKESAK